MSKDITDRLSEEKQQEMEDLARECLKQRRKEKTAKRKKKEARKSMKKLFQKETGQEWPQQSVKVCVHHKSNKKLTISWYDGSSPSGVDEDELAKNDMELFKQYQEIKEKYRGYTDWETVQVTESDR